jgi:uncharacterized repeat protein (TIGR01451 family)
MARQSTFRVLALFPLLAGIGANAVTVQMILMNPAFCIYNTGVLQAYATGGVGPYTYQWSTGATTEVIQDLAAGTYSVTVTDFNNEQGFAQYTMVAEPLVSPYTYWLPGCPADAGVATKRLFAPYSIASFGMPFWDIGGVVGLNEDYFYVGQFGAGSIGNYTATITDGNGCTTTINTTIPPDPVWPVPQVLSIDGACSGGANGSINVHVPGNAAGWSTGLRIYRSGVLYQWSNGLGDASNGHGTIPSTGRSLTAANLEPGTYQLVSVVDWADDNVLLQTVFAGMPALCSDTLVVEVPDLGFTCGTLSGRAFVDANENCVQNGGDPNLPATVVEVQPGGYYALTNSAGQYAMNLPYGTYTVTTVNPIYQEHCGVSTTPFTLFAGQPNVTRQLADTSLVGLDLEVVASSGAARPGFEVGYSIVLRNLTGVLAGTGIVTMTFDPALIYLSASPNPASVVGNTITWNTNSIGVFQGRGFWPRFQVPPDINLLGTVLTSTISGSVANPEADLSNNSYVHEVTVTGAYDPNDKVAQTSSRQSSEIYFIDGDDWIDYTIRFQNTGTDTAFFVVITDTLPSTLDPATFQAGAASHASHSVAMLGQGIVRWTFPNILLPDSNVNEPRSHGFVSFRIRPRLPLLPGTMIENIANIYFDYNPPVITEPSALVATTGTGLVERSLGGPELYPNPVTDHLRLVWPDAAGRTGTWSILALDGRWISQGTITSDNQWIDIGSMASGMYMLRVQADGIETVHPFLRAEQ